MSEHIVALALPAAQPLSSVRWVRPMRTVVPAPCSASPKPAIVFLLYQKGRDSRIQFAPVSSQLMI